MDTSTKQEWELWYTYHHDGKSGLINLVTVAKDEEDAKNKAAQAFKLTRGECVFWFAKRLK